MYANSMYMKVIAARKSRRLRRGDRPPPDAHIRHGMRPFGPISDLPSMTFGESRAGAVVSAPAFAGAEGLTPAGGELISVHYVCRRMVTSAENCALMPAPRRWDGGSPAGPRLSAGAGGCSPMLRPVGGQTIRAPVREVGMRRSRSPRPRSIGGQASQASSGRRRRPGRAFFAPSTGVKVTAIGREPGRPAPPHLLGRWAAARLNVLGSSAMAGGPTVL
jgi:hypothetical protein